jgi:hypothetical protein
MIRFAFTLVLFFIFTSLYAQDNIILRNGDEVKGKVLEITDEYVKFKPADNPDGPVYSYKKSEIFMIKYENGKKELFNEIQNSSPVIYAAAYKDKSGESSFSFIVRAGWEYSHRDESSSQYVLYDDYFANTENNFYCDILAGKRKKHYQFGAGLGVYLKDLKVHYSYIDYNNHTPVDAHSHFRGIGLALIFANKIYLLDKKFSPFILGDAAIAFDNVITLKKGYQDYYAGNYYYYFPTTTYTNLNFVFGAGLQIKTQKKCKLQVELGVKLNPDYNQYFNRSALHTGFSFVF